MVDSDMARLCRKIYQEHKRALDLIYEHRSDPQVDIGNLLRRLIDSDGRVTYKSRFKQTYIYFHPRGWGTSTHGSLDFVFHNLPDALELFIEVSGVDEEARPRLFDVARGNIPLFGQFMENPGTGLNPKLYRRTFLSRRFYEEASDSEREEEIRRHWAEFPKMTYHVSTPPSRKRSGPGNTVKLKILLNALEPIDQRPLESVLAPCLRPASSLGIDRCGSLK